MPPVILQLMSGKVLHHRTPEFERVLKSAWSGLKSVFNTHQPVMILSGTGSAAMEAAVVNTLSPGDEALVVVSGKFGERWAEMCERFGVKTHRLNVPWGQALDLSQFEAELLKHKNLRAVFTQACETSTATLHPVQKMSQLVHKHTSALFAVDAITAVGCMDLPMDKWELDVVVAGSQKAFMIPTGLSFIALSERAWKQHEQSKIGKFYFDLSLEKKSNAKCETHFSTPTPLIVALEAVLAQMQKRGMDAVIKRCHVLAEATRTTGQALGLEVYSQSPSDSVTALTTPMNSAELRDWLEKERKITIMGGQDQLKGKVIRIGHMGDVRDEDMVALFEALSEKLNRQVDLSDLKRTLKTVEPLF